MIKEKINILLQESAVVKTVQKDVKSVADLQKAMFDVSKGNSFCWTVGVVFGTAFMKAYKSPSTINYNDVGDSPWQLKEKGYWRNGKFLPFPKDKVIKYQNTGYQD